MMKVIIAGSRTIWSYKSVCEAVAISGFTISKVISGNAKGIDKIGIIWALINKKPFQIFNADWKKYGNRSAGFIRNNHMAKEGDALIAIWNGHSTGTKHMIDIANKYGLEVFILIK